MTGTRAKTESAADPVDSQPELLEQDWLNEFAKIFGPPLTGDALARRKRLRRAQEDASCCAQCGKSIGAGQPVWRRRRSLGRGFVGWRYTVAPHCVRCSSKQFRFYLSPRACEACGRKVFEHVGASKNHHRTFCCHKCERQMRATEARRRRADVRGASRPCKVCGEHFEPSRKDSCYCGSACRQKAYRRRVTDNDWVLKNPIDIRNADPSHATSGIWIKPRCRCMDWSESKKDETPASGSEGSGTKPPGPKGRPSGTKRDMGFAAASRRDGEGNL